MSTSNTTSFNQDALQIITDTLNLLGVYGQGDTITTADYNFCLNFLNKMVKAWEGRGIHLWTSSEGALFLTKNQQSYGLASADLDIAGDTPTINTLSTTATGATLLLVLPNASTGVTVGDNIGIQLDAGIIYWTTINTINSPTQFTINGTLPSQASAGNSVFSFTNRIDRPLYITNSRFYTQGGYERPITVMGRTQFMYMPVKTETGKANQWFYAPHVSDATYYVWPTADSVGDCIKFSYIRRIQDFVNQTDTADLPQEWLETMTLNLGVKVAPAYGISLAKTFPDLIKDAQSSLEMMEMFDSEEGSLHIVPNYNFSDGND